MHKSKINNKIVLSFTKKIKNLFKKRIVSLIYYGSKKYNRGSKDSDYDFYLLLDHISSKDCDIIRSVKKIFKKIDLAIYYKDILPKNPAYFINETQGAYFIECLSLGDLLLGKNIFKKYHSLLSKKEKKKSLYLKIQSYFTKILKENVNDKDFSKYYIRILQNVLMFKDLENLEKLRFLEKSKILLLAIKHGIFPENQYQYIFGSEKGKIYKNKGDLLVILSKIIRNLKI